MVILALVLAVGLQDPEKEVVVTAMKHETPIEQVGQSVTVIPSEVIERRQKRDVLQLLREVPGLSVVQTGSRGGTTAVYSRGGEPDYNLIMLDGIQLNRGGGAFEFSTLAADGLQRIEILRGPTSSLYGSDAISSAINLVSKRGSGPARASVMVMGGTFRTLEERFTFSGGNAEYGYFLTIGRYDTNGILSLNNDAENTTARIRFDVNASPELTFGVTAAYIDNEFHFPTDFVAGQGFPAVDPNQGQETEELVFGIDMAYIAAPWWEHRAKLGIYDLGKRDFDPRDPIPSDTSDSQTLTDERRITFDYRQLFITTLWSHLDSLLTIGFEAEAEEFSQRGTGFVDDSRKNLAGYLQEELAFDKAVFVTIGARYDDNSRFGHSTNPRASFAAILEPTGTKFRGAVGTGFKEPSFLENFGAGTVVGNRDLDPEKSFSWEAGVDQELVGEDLVLTATYFQNRFKNMIAFTGSVMFGGYENIQEATTYGVETGLRCRITREVRVGLSYTLLRTRVIDDGGFGGTTFVEGEDLLRRPRHSGAFFTDLLLGDLTVSLSGVAVGPRIDREFATSSAGTRVRNEGYVKVDLAATYRVHHDAETGREFKLRVLLQNLLNEEYKEAFSHESPGFSIMAGIDATF